VPGGVAFEARQTLESDEQEKSQQFRGSLARSRDSRSVGVQLLAAAEGKRGKQKCKGKATRYSGFRLSCKGAPLGSRSRLSGSVRSGSARRLHGDAASRGRERPSDPRAAPAPRQSSGLDTRGAKAARLRQSAQRV